MRNDNGLSVLGYVLVALIAAGILVPIACCVGSALIGAGSEVSGGAP